MQSQQRPGGSVAMKQQNSIKGAFASLRDRINLMLMPGDSGAAANPRNKNNNKGLRQRPPGLSILPVHARTELQGSGAIVAKPAPGLHPESPASPISPRPKASKMDTRDVCLSVESSAETRKGVDEKGYDSDCESCFSGPSLSGSVFEDDDNETMGDVGMGDLDLQDLDEHAAEIEEDEDDEAEQNKLLKTRKRKQATKSPLPKDDFSSPSSRAGGVSQVQSSQSQQASKGAQRNHHRHNHPRVVACPRPQTKKANVTIDLPTIAHTSIILEKELGFGASGRVFQVRLIGESSNHAYALKVIPLPADPVTRDTVLKHVYVECHMMSLLKGHPNIVQLYGIVPHPQQREIGILTELCNQGDVLDYLIQGKPKNERIISNWTRQILSGIAHMHKLGVQHRDIKPENIFLNLLPSGEVVAKIGDFGLSRVMSKDYSLQLGGPFACTDLYAPPEVILQNKEAPGFSADIWGLGIVVFIMMAGYHPFDEAGKGFSPQLRQRVLNNAWNFKQKPWTGASELAKDFITGTLQNDHTVRLTAKAALMHPWLSR